MFQEVSYVVVMDLLKQPVGLESKSTGNNSFAPQKNTACCITDLNRTKMAELNV